MKKFFYYLLLSCVFLMLTACGKPDSQKAFEERFSIVEEKLPAVELVRKATLQKLGRFTKQDIIELCPALSVSSIEGSLKKLIDKGEIKREGVGRATKHIRLK